MTSPSTSSADHVGIVTAVNSNGTIQVENGDFSGGVRNMGWQTPSVYAAAGRS